MIVDETFTLAKGVTIPKLGLGMWMIEVGEAAQAVRDAAGIGYRHFGTAQAYGNERSVGEGLRSCGVARESLFVTTKLQADCKTYTGAKAAIEESLAELALDHIDLMIIHSPQPWSEFGGAERYYEGNRQAWGALEEAYAAGKLRAIGVSNFEQVDLENILASCRVRPMVNQVLAHVGNTPFELIAYSRREGRRASSRCSARGCRVSRAGGSRVAADPSVWRQSASPVPTADPPEVAYGSFWRVGSRPRSGPFRCPIVGRGADGAERPL